MASNSWPNNRLYPILLLVLCLLAVSYEFPRAETISQKQAQVDQLSAQLNTLENEINTLVELNAALQNHIGVLNEQILATGLQLDDANNRLDRAEKVYHNRLKEIYKKGPMTAVEIVLSARDFRDFLVRLDFLSRISLMDARIVQNVHSEKRAVEQLMDRLSEQKRQQLYLQRKYEQDLASLQEKKKQMETLLAQAGTELQQMIKAEQDRIARERMLAKQNSLPPGSPVEIVECTVYPYLDETFLTTVRMPKSFNATGQKITGLASWYGNEFNGRGTSSGEIFNENDFTCAYTTGRWLPAGYPELPLGTFLAIRYQGKKIVVKINDRGPFVAGRVLDLSKAAAQTLGYSGVVQVEAEVVTPQ